MQCNSCRDVIKKETISFLLVFYFTVVVDFALLSATLRALIKSWIEGSVSATRKGQRLREPKRTEKHEYYNKNIQISCRLLIKTFFCMFCKLLWTVHRSVILKINLITILKSMVQKRKKADHRKKKFPLFFTDSLGWMNKIHFKNCQLSQKKPINDQNVLLHKWMHSKA